MAAKRASDMGNTKDAYNLKRFVEAQEGIYGQALRELRNGQKESHWMWFIFPQIDGLGSSSTARHYAIKSLEEARAYLAHPVLGTRLKECCEAILAIRGRTASEIFDFPDDLKLRSSMTLFAVAEKGDSLFSRVLDKYFGGKMDERTLQIMGLEQAGGAT